MDEPRITLEHRELLESKLRQLNSDLIDYTFTNLYLFRDVHDFRLVQKKHLYIRGKTRDGVAYLMPTETGFVWDEIGSETLFPIPEEWMSHFDKERFEWNSVDMDDDYLYLTAKMAHLPGRKLSGRRNLIHQFLDHYPDHTVYPLTQERSEDALQVLEKWKEHPHHDPKYTDYDACKEALGLIDRLHLDGCIVYVDKRPAGFLLGEGIGKKTYVYHMAKALTEFKGIYQFLFENCAQSIEKEYEWINLGQDIGSADIRHSKRAYQPDKLLKKWRVNKK